MNNKSFQSELINCIIGLVLLIPTIVGVISFMLQLFEADTDFSTMRNLSYNWSMDSATYATPIYWGLMSIAGAYLIKDALSAIIYVLRKLINR